MTDSDLTKYDWRRRLGDGGSGDYMDRVADAAKKCPSHLPGQRLVISNSSALARSDGGRGSP